MIDVIRNIWQFLSRDPILASVTAAIIFAALALSYRLILSQKLTNKKFLLGHYYGYHPLDGGGIVSWSVELRKTGRGNISVRMREKNSAAYEYEGLLSTRENYLYSYLQGKTHDTNAFLVLSTPFNRSNAMPGTSGILCGVTPERDVTAVKYLLCRTPMLESEIEVYFGEGTAGRIKADEHPFADLMKAKDKEKL